MSKVSVRVGFFMLLLVFLSACGASNQPNPPAELSSGQIIAILVFIIIILLSVIFYTQLNQQKVVSEERYNQIVSMSPVPSSYLVENVDIFKLSKAEEIALISVALSGGEYNVRMIVRTPSGYTAMRELSIKSNGLISYINPIRALLK